MGMAIPQIFSIGEAADRDEEIVIRIVLPVEIEARRHNADHCPAFAVVGDGFTNQMRISAEMPLPQTITENDDRCCAGLVFIIIEEAPDVRLNAESWKEARRHPSPEDALRFTVTSKNATSHPERCHVFKDSLLR